jgi:hypothetical protein
MWKLLVVGLVLLGLLIPVAVSADPTILVFNTPEFGITGFTATYVSDTQVDLAWTETPNVANTMVRVAFGYMPTSRTDGYQVYYGPDTSFSDTTVNLSFSETPYYRAWGQQADGTWVEQTTTVEAWFMSDSFLFIGLILLGMGLTILSFMKHFLPLAMASAIMWLALGTWLLLGNVTNLSITQSWGQLLAFVFVLMAFVPILWFIGNMGKTQMSTYDSNTGRTIQMWGKPPKDPRTRSQIAYETHRANMHSKASSSPTPHRKVRRAE